MKLPLLSHKETLYLLLIHVVGVISSDELSPQLSQMLASGSNHTTWQLGMLGNKEHWCCSVCLPETGTAGAVIAGTVTAGTVTAGTVETGVGLLKSPFRAGTDTTFSAGAGVSCSCQPSETVVSGPGAW